MSTTFIRASLASAAASAALTFTRPGYGEETEPLRNGDILFMWLGVGDRTVEGSTLVLPEGWTFYSVGYWDGVSSTRLYLAFRYITDIDNEPVDYTFTYSATRALIGTMLAYRGVIRDVEYDPPNYPYGYFAPYGTTGNSSATQDNVLITVGLGGTATFRRFARVFRCVVFNHASNVPRLDDPSPLVAIRARHAIAKVAMMVVDTEEEELTGDVSDVTVRSNANGQYVAAVVGFEPIFDVASSFDNYKSKMIRSFFTPPYDPSLDTPLGKLLAVIGTLDNDIGGLHGDADFLPDDPNGSL